MGSRRSGQAVDLHRFPDHDPTRCAARAPGGAWSTRGSRDVPRAARGVRLPPPPERRNPFPGGPGHGTCIAARTPIALRSEPITARPVYVSRWFCGAGRSSGAYPRLQHVARLALALDRPVHHYSPHTLPPDRTNIILYGKGSVSNKCGQTRDNIKNEYVRILRSLDRVWFERGFVREDLLSTGGLERADKRMDINLGEAAPTSTDLHGAMPAKVQWTNRTNA